MSVCYCFPYPISSIILKNKFIYMFNIIKLPINVFVTRNINFIVMIFFVIKYDFKHNNFQFLVWNNTGNYTSCNPCE